MAQWGQLGFQDASSPLMESLISFHDSALLVLILIISLVAYVAAFLMFNVFVSRFVVEGQVLESVWTVLPGLILIFLALPSLRLLYLLDEVSSGGITLKTIGHQWYWSYEYSDFLAISYDSYMIPTDELEGGDFRLLEVDNRVILPANSSVRVLVASSDVIHSWTVPSLGVKADAIPGRLNQLSFFTNRFGVFYGQCSEICGANHSFMPIVVEVVSVDSFLKWLQGMQLALEA
uniref:Cytochrome c oxidase subunit 2 n=1 Tax=Phasianella solida TaxID=335754 RepID=A0A0S1F5P6_9VEST|nr:cytochrome c oxidase subunit II [Phasianella solida]ALK03390.1 cytochrome c oxidase subunit II [Phasianella solida]